jgi:hypothetical protein
VQAQGAFIEVNQEDLRDIQISLTAELARAYFDLRGAQEQLAVASQNAENQRRTFNLTREAAPGGPGTAFDTERAQAQLSTTLASIPTPGKPGAGSPVRDRRPGWASSPRWRLSSKLRNPCPYFPISESSRLPIRSFGEDPMSQPRNGRWRVERALVGSRKGRLPPPPQSGWDRGITLQPSLVVWETTGRSATRLVR